MKHFSWGRHPLFVGGLHLQLPALNNAFGVRIFYLERSPDMSRTSHHTLNALFLWTALALPAMAGSGRTTQKATSTVTGTSLTHADNLAVTSDQPSSGGSNHVVQAAALLRNALVAMMAISDPTLVETGITGSTSRLFQPAPAGMGVGIPILSAAETLPLVRYTEHWPLALSAAICPLTVPADTSVSQPAGTFPLDLEAMGRGTVVSGPDASVPDALISYAFRVGKVGGQVNGFLAFDIGRTGFTFSGTVLTVEVLEVDDQGAPQVLCFTGISSNQDGGQFQCTVGGPGSGSNGRSQISLSWQGSPMAAELPFSTIEEGYLKIESGEQA